MSSASSSTSTAASVPSVSLADQLNEIRTLCGTIQQTVGNWEALKLQHGVITTRLRTAVQILYAEGLTLSTGELFRTHFIPRTLAQLQAINQKDYSDVNAAVTVYTRDEVRRVPEAIRLTVGELLSTPTQTLATDEFANVPLKGLSYLTDRPWVLPTIFMVPFKIGSGAAEDILGGVDDFDTAVLRSDKSVTITNTLNVNCMIRTVTISDYELVWTQALQNPLGTTFRFPTDLIRIVTSYTCESSVWNAHFNHQITKPYPSYMLVRSPSGLLNSTSYDSEMSHIKALGPNKSNWFVNDAVYGLVTHIQVSLPTPHDIIFTGRNDLGFVTYDARSIWYEGIQRGGMMGTYTHLSAMGMEYILYSYNPLDGASAIYVNGVVVQKADTKPEKPSEATNAASSSTSSTSTLSRADILRRKRKTQTAADAPT